MNTDFVRIQCNIYNVWEASAARAACLPGDVSGVIVADSLSNVFRKLMLGRYEEIVLLPRHGGQITLP